MSAGLTFDEWLAHAFDHPGDDPEWMDRKDSPYWRDTSAIKAAYITETFKNADRHLSRFDDRQLENGLDLVVRAGASGYLLQALETEVALDARLSLVRSTTDLFQKLFAARCPEFRPAIVTPLYGICGQFWRVFPIRRPQDDPGRVPLHRARLEAMESILAIDNRMCRYSALAGLALLTQWEPEDAAGVLERYLARTPEPPLADYARDALTGYEI